MNAEKRTRLLPGTALLLVLLAGCGGWNEASKSSRRGTAELPGPRRRGGAGAARDVTVLNFWALTCPPCIAEMPEIAAFEKALPDNVAMVTVCLDGYGNEDSLSEVGEQASFECVTLISGDGGLLDLAGNLMYTPTTVLADSGGTLVGKAIIFRPCASAGWDWRSF